MMSWLIVLGLCFLVAFLAEYLSAKLNGSVLPIIAASISWVFFVEKVFGEVPLLSSRYLVPLLVGVIGLVIGFVLFRIKPISPESSDDPTREE